MFDLLLDSSNKSLLVAVAKDEKIIDRIEYDAWQKQSEYMTDELDKLLKKNNILPQQIDSVILTIGPGSYTGIRIGLTIGKIFAYAMKIKVYPLSSLQILKTIKKPSICLINARSNRSYIGVYNDNEVILKDQIMSNDEVLNFIKEHNSYDVCGDVSYLGLTGKKNDIALNMINLKPFNTAVEPIFVKPVYLKD